MKVQLKNAWFAPSPQKRLNDLQVRAGQYFDKGVHHMDDGLKPFLPKTAIILEGTAAERKEEADTKRRKAEKKSERVKKQEAELTLKDYDMERANADEFIRIAEEAEARK